MKTISQSFSASVSLQFTRMLTDYTLSHGISHESLFDSVGLDAKMLETPEGRMPYKSFAKLCESAALLLKDPYLGLHLGQSVKVGYLGSHGFAMMSSGNVRDLLDRSLRYSALVIDAFHNEYVENGQECVRYWYSNLPDHAASERLQDELNMSLWVSFARWILGRSDIKPRWASFRYAKPAQTHEYEALFNCPLYFDAPDTAIAFDRSLLDLQLPQVNIPVQRMMDAHCERLLGQLGNELIPSWLAICRRSILKSFEHGMPELPEIAKSVGLSPEELRKRLSERGTGFRELVDNLRQELALIYMRDPSLSLVDTAYLLGFSEQSAFQRAFKRWIGITPGEYVHKLLLTSH